jgi:hypothetical protein
MSRIHGATVYQLGSLLPEQEVPLTTMVAQIDALQQEALFDIHTLADNGANVSGFKAELDAFTASSGQLAGELTILDEAHIPSWKGRANAVVVGLTDLMRRLEASKQSSFELSGRRGLEWGLGVSVVVAATAYFVWRRKKRGRRRAR